MHGIPAKYARLEDNYHVENNSTEPAMRIPPFKQLICRIQVALQEGAGESAAQDGQWKTRMCKDQAKLAEQIKTLEKMIDKKFERLMEHIQATNAKPSRLDPAAINKQAMNASRDGANAVVGVGKFVWSAATMASKATAAAAAKTTTATAAVATNALRGKRAPASDAAAAPVHTSDEVGPPVHTSDEVGHQAHSGSDEQMPPGGKQGRLTGTSLMCQRLPKRSPQVPATSKAAESIETQVPQ